MTSQTDTSQIRRRVKVVVSVVAGAMVILVTWYVLRQIPEVRAKITVTRMMELYHYLEYKKPLDLRGNGLEQALAGTKLYPTHLKDAWGNRFEVTVELDSAGKPHYTIRSYGADHKRGGCCERFVYHRDWAADAILKDGNWLQVWAEVP